MGRRLSLGHAKRCGQLGNLKCHAKAFEQASCRWCTLSCLCNFRAAALLLLAITVPLATGCSPPVRDVNHDFGTVGWSGPDIVTRIGGGWMRLNTSTGSWNETPNATLSHGNAPPEWSMPDSEGGYILQFITQDANLGSMCGPSFLDVGVRLADSETGETLQEWRSPDWPRGMGWQGVAGGNATHGFVYDGNESKLWRWAWSDPSQRSAIDIPLNITVSHFGGLLWPMLRLPGDLLGISGASALAVVRLEGGQPILLAPVPNAVWSEMGGSFIATGSSVGVLDVVNGHPAWRLLLSGGVDVLQSSWTLSGQLFIVHQYGVSHFRAFRGSEEIPNAIDSAGWTPQGVAAGPDGLLAITETNSTPGVGRVRILDADLHVLKTFYYPEPTPGTPTSTNATTSPPSMDPSGTTSGAPAPGAFAVLFLLAVGAVIHARKRKG